MMQVERVVWRGCRPDDFGVLLSKKNGTKERCPRLSCRKRDKNRRCAPQLVRRLARRRHRPVSVGLFDLPHSVNLGSDSSTDLLPSMENGIGN